MSHRPLTNTSSLKIAAAYYTVICKITASVFLIFCSVIPEKSLEEAVVKPSVADPDLLGSSSFLGQIRIRIKA
jgi:hypothetical protein